MWLLVRGGLGNQMFQAAFGVALASRFGRRPRWVDLGNRFRVPRPWGLSCFGLEPEAMRPAAEFGLAALSLGARKMQQFGLGNLPGLLVEQEEFAGPPTLSRAPYLVSGYWQGWRYFEGYEASVRKAFTFPELPVQWNVLPVDGSKPWVAIHVRRGDYVHDPVARAIHLVCDADWYRAAWQQMKQRVTDAMPVVFSDDPDWARKHLGLEGDAHFVAVDPARPAWADLAQMSRCQHFVISNSTYSWWAAWLGHTERAQVIAPSQWLKGRSTAALGVALPTWHLL